MQQWGGTMNYRPEKKRPKEKRRERIVREPSVAQRGEVERETVATEFRVGKTIAGSANESRKRNLEHIANRKRRQVRNVIITVILLGAVAAVVIIFVNYLRDIAAEREALIAVDNPIVPTVTILDENVGNNLSERTKLFVARLEKDAKDSGKEIDHVVLPFQKARELDIYFKGRGEYYKMTMERGSAVQMEDAERMMRYLDGKDLHPSYVDLRVEGKAYYK